MKGVTFIRVKLHPVAECQHIGCGWKFEGSSIITPPTVRSRAGIHARREDHIVTVTVRDVTEYSRDDRQVAR